MLRWRFLRIVVTSVPSVLMQRLELVSNKLSIRCLHYNHVSIEGLLGAHTLRQCYSLCNSPTNFIALSNSASHASRFPRAKPMSPELNIQYIAPQPHLKQA